MGPNYEASFETKLLNLERSGIDEVLEGGVEVAGMDFRLGDGFDVGEDVVGRVAENAVRSVVEYLDHERFNARDEEAYLNLRERTLEEQTRSSRIWVFGMG
ncbi:hypothetical protein HDV00_009926 [Rhizophlyctis rosea]|nr:hypothetical protein HDV00_009926 [Rhizophlyctis rosea]